MIDSASDPKPSWLELAFSLEGSVIPKILPRIILFALLATAVCSLQYVDYPQFIERVGGLTNNVVYNLVLGLLLVFRTNTSYDRFWEGRKALGILVLNIRNMGRFIRLTIPETTPEEKAQKAAILKLLAAFFIATKLQLRGESANEELKELLSPQQQQQIATSTRMSLQISLWIGEYFQQQYRAGKIEANQRVELNQLLNDAIEGLGACERIASTPLPVAYRIYLKRLILIYCIGLPFNLVIDMQWLTVPIVAIVSFILLGVEEVGKEIENPFLQGINDLPVDTIAQNVIRDLNTIANFSSDKLTPLKEIATVEELIHNE